MGARVGRCVVGEGVWLVEWVVGALVGWVGAWVVG